MNQSAEQQDAPELGPKGAVGALADCALNAREAAVALDLVLASSELKQAWDELHWVGDCLRSDETGALPGGAAFMARFHDVLAAEPTILAPSRYVEATQRRWLRYGMPAAAALVVVSTAVWIMVPGSNTSLVADDSASLQPVSGVATPAVARTVKAVDPAQLNEYLAAHQEYSRTALHGPGSIQAASFNMVADGGRDHP